MDLRELPWTLQAAKGPIMIPFQILGMAILVTLAGMAVVHLVVRRSKRKRAKRGRELAESIDTATSDVSTLLANSLPSYTIAVRTYGHRGALIIIHAEGSGIHPRHIRMGVANLLSDYGWDDGDLDGHWEIVVFGGMPVERPPAVNRWGGFALVLKGAK